jgi:hypothetical protein
LVDATLNAPQAELPAILAAAKVYGVSGLDKLSGAGTMTLDMHAAVPRQSITSDEIMRALNGNVNLNFYNVRYSGVDIGHQLASVGQVLNSAQSLQKDQGFTNILKVTGNVVVRNGMAQTNNLQALLDVANVGITGTANLVSQALNLDVTAVVSKGFSQHWWDRHRRVHEHGAGQHPGRTGNTRNCHGHFPPSNIRSQCPKDCPNETKGPDAECGQSTRRGLWHSGEPAGAKECDSQSRPTAEHSTAGKSCRPDHQHCWQEQKQNTDQPPPKKQNTGLESTSRTGLGPVRM